MLSGKNIIGQNVSSEGNKTYTTFNPLLNIANSTEFYEATTEEINLAVALAKQAYHSYATLEGSKKAQFLNAIADEILALDDELIKTYCAETGLAEGRAKGERGRTVGQLRAFANLVVEGSWVQATIDTAQPTREPMPRADLRKMQVPLGPVVVFGASNFPLAYSTAGGDTAAALAAGCPVLVKSHPMHAGTGELVAQAIQKASKNTGMPEGVFSNLNSSGIEVGVQLVQHPEVKAVGFTGSIYGGRALFNLASQREEPIPVFAEMGSINPVILLPEAAKTKATSWAENYAGSITLGSGQFCTNPGLILGIKSPDMDAFIEHLSDEIVKKEPTSMLHPNIIGAYESKKEKAIAQEGTTVVADYSAEVQTNFARQTVLTVKGHTYLKNNSLHQEVFGPFSMVVVCDDASQLLEIVSKLEGQLTGTILAEEQELETHRDIVAALQSRVGRLIFNGVPTGVEVCASMQHGGPYPASTDSRFTAVGVHSINRWVRPVSFQNWPDKALPKSLQNANPLGITRTIDGQLSKESL